MEPTNVPSSRPLHENYELLADYVDGLLDERARAALEVKLRTSEEARAVVAGIRYFYASEGTDRAALEQYLDAQQARMEASWNQWKQGEVPLVRPLRRRVSWMAAAVLALLLMLGGIAWWVWESQQWTPNHLVAMHLAEPYRLPLTLRGDAPAGGDAKQRAYEAYANGAYQQAAEALQDLPARTAFDDFALGLSFLYAEDYDLAAPQLEEVIGRDPRLEEQARWLAALARLRQGDREAARTHLAYIVRRPVHYRRKAAVQLLDSLDKD